MKFWNSLAAALVLIFATGAWAETDPPRNIVFILIDDMRFDSMSCMGHPFLETPHLDALAENGVLFKKAFVTTALCSPSRASILSGQYAHRHQVLNNSTPFPKGVPTFPESLQQGGYQTAFVGKWHMGGDSDDPRPGFDHWVSFKGQGTYRDPSLNINDKPGKVAGYTTDILTDHAVEYLNRDHQEPFLLYLSHKAVHADFDPADRHKGSYANKQYPYPASMANTNENYHGKPEWVRRQRNSWHGVDGMYNKDVHFDDFTKRYTETMRAVDDSVGRVVEALKAKGLLESTLLVFTSDNGFMFGEHGLIDKRTMYETSIRVPLIVHCPDLVPGGQTREEMVLNLDFAPTFLEAAGLPVPDSMQGQSFLPLLEGKGTDWRTSFLYEYYWERSFAQTPTVTGVRTDKYKLMRYHGVWDKYELYDMEDDPEERNNLLGDYLVGTESGTLDNHIRRTAPKELGDLFTDLNKQLLALLEETGSLDEPTWKAD